MSPDLPDMPAVPTPPGSYADALAGPLPSSAPAYDVPRDDAPPPARLLVLVDTLAAGGAERVAVELACAVDRDRFDPLVVATRSGGPLSLHLDAHRVPYVVLGRTRRFDLRAWRRLRRLARGADLVHSHKLGSNFWGALLARRAPLGTNTPLIAHEHNFAGSDSARQAFLDRVVVGGAATRVVCVSESVAATQARHGVHPHKLSIVHNGVRLESAWPRSAARADLGLPEAGVPVLGIVARLRPEKAHDVLLDAVAELHASARPVTLCIVGEGPCRDALQARAASLGIEHAVVWAGERPDAARLAGAFDLGIVCSHWEGMPLAALESLAAGVPLVASAVGALPELVDPPGAVAAPPGSLAAHAVAADPTGATAAAGAPAGALVPPGDAHALAAAIGRLLEDPVQLRELGRNGQRRVRESYGFARMVHRVQGVYDIALAEVEATPSGPWQLDDVARAARGRRVTIELEGREAA